MHKLIRAILVDDEDKSLKNLRRLIEMSCKDVEIIGEADSIETAIELLSKTSPDLVFLDIEMSDGSGFDLLRNIGSQKFQVIFVTAHSHYAVKAFKYAATDYLLKPIDIDDLVNAVSKVKSIKENGLKSIIQSDHVSGYLELRSGDGTLYVKLDDIVRLEANGSYTNVYLVNKEKYCLSYNIGHFMDQLNQNFLRVHKSHIINMRFVKKFTRSEGYCVELTDGSVVDISRRLKDQFLQMLKNSRV